MTRTLAPQGGRSEAFFRNPPWQGGVPRYRMGLAPIPLSEWLPDAADSGDVERKSALYASRFDDVFAVLEEAWPHLDPCVDLLREHCHGRAFATPVHPEWPPLAAAALWVPDDLCLMVRTGDDYRLAAASLCSPSFWSLRDKLGAELHALHEGHDGLNPMLGARMQEVFERLPGDRVLERRNWFLHGPGDLFEPRDRVIEPVADMADHVVRTERQTLRRLNDHCIIFTIRVRLIPFAWIGNFPVAASDMAKTVRALTAPELKAFSVRGRIPELLAFLDDIAAGRAQQTGARG